LVHLACVESAEHHVSRETDLAFADVVREGDLRRQLLLEGKETLSEALSQAIQAANVAAGTPSSLRQESAGPRPYPEVAERDCSSQAKPQ
jgi:hypothetical protein